MTVHISDGGTDADGAADSRAAAATPDRVDRLAAEYRAAGRPFALVTVVRREAPVSAHVGDRAVVTPDGSITGWIGGIACAQSVAVEEATAAIESGDPVFVGLAPDPEAVARPGLEAYPMTCHSGGTLELFVDPVLPAPGLVVIGESPIARTLARLAGETNYDVTIVTGPDTSPSADDFDGVDAAVSVTDADALSAAVADAAAAVVASMGAYDVRGIEAALDAGVPCVELVASETRWDELADEVASGRGVETAAVHDAVRTPAGLDIGAETPEEIGVSILAELVAVRNGADADAGAAELVDADADADSPEPTERDAVADDASGGRTVVDPVCGMDVDVDDAAATVTHRGDRYRFCGEGCAEAFAADPGRYLDEGVPTGE
jgi:xanthine dehydrogenase accessory factor